MMQLSKEHIRHILIFEFNKKSPVEDAHKAITNTYGERVIGLGTCQKWYYKFHNGNFDISDKPKSGRKVKFNVEKLEEAIKRDNMQSLAELEKALDAKSSTIGRHLKRLGFVHRYGHWVKKLVRGSGSANDISNQIQTQLQPEAETEEEALAQIQAQTHAHAQAQVETVTYTEILEQEQTQRQRQIPEPKIKREQKNLHTLLLSKKQEEQSQRIVEIPSLSLSLPSLSQNRFNSKSNPHQSDSSSRFNSSYITNLLNE